MFSGALLSNGCRLARAACRSTRSPKHKTGWSKITAELIAGRAAVGIVCGRPVAAGRPLSGLGTAVQAHAANTGDCGIPSAANTNHRRTAASAPVTRPFGDGGLLTSGVLRALPAAHCCSEQEHDRHRIAVDREVDGPYQRGGHHLSSPSAGGPCPLRRRWPGLGAAHEFTGPFVIGRTLEWLWAAARNEKDDLLRAGRRRVRLGLSPLPSLRLREGGSPGSSPTPELFSQPGDRPGAEEGRERVTMSGTCRR